MRNQAIEYGARYLQAQVHEVDVSGENKIVYTPEGVFSGKTLVLATGAMGRTSFLDGEEQYLGRGVSYCATCDAAFFKGQDVAVYGENQESIDEALVLSKFASTVHWVAKRSPSKTLKGVSQLEKLENIETNNDENKEESAQREALSAVEEESAGKSKKEAAPAKVEEPAATLGEPAATPATEQEGQASGKNKKRKNKKKKKKAGEEQVQNEDQKDDQEEQDPAACAERKEEPHDRGDGTTSANGHSKQKTPEIVVSPPSPEQPMDATATAVQE